MKLNHCKFALFLLKLNHASLVNERKRIFFCLCHMQSCEHYSRSSNTVHCPFKDVQRILCDSPSLNNFMHLPFPQESDMNQQGQFFPFNSAYTQALAVCISLPQALLLEDFHTGTRGCIFMKSMKCGFKHDTLSIGKN